MQDQLVDLIDQHGLYAVLDCISGICRQHAENSGTCTAVDNWSSAEAALDAAASKVLDLFVHTP